MSSIQEGEVHIRSYESKIPEMFVKHVHTYLSEGREAKKVEESLEKLYDIFIRPISDLLCHMRPEDKLVFALDEVPEILRVTLAFPTLT